jgi:NADPH:quinone reductase-like Zn-dependent oxidoreductase
MQAYRIRPGAGIDALEAFQPAAAPPKAREVRVRTHAVSLNYRDLTTARGDHHPSEKFIIPCSDSAGEVIGVGAEVTRFKVGDRVASVFYPRWIDGEAAPEKTALALAGAVDGVLAEETTFHEDALIRIPAHLDYVEGATLPCAGVTAWHALFVAARLQPGKLVLLLGTGGVSLWALQLAKAAGLRVILTSSDDAKLERARKLGADAVINYRSTPEWEVEAVRLSGGRGADLVVEVGGQGTLKRSIAAARMCGTVAIIGGLTGYGGQLEPFAMIRGLKHLVGVLVGSRAMAEDLCRFVELAQIRPVIDRVFAFDQAREAYRYLEAARPFGKVVIVTAASARRP